MTPRTFINKNSTPAVPVPRTDNRQDALWMENVRERLKKLENDIAALRESTLAMIDDEISDGGGGGSGTGLTFIGTWDASVGNAPSDNPDLGSYWIVTVAGNAVVGTTDFWQVGDLAVYDGTVGWFKVANTGIFRDSEFFLLDNLDQSKVAMFESSSITPSTTRTYTLPDQSGDVAVTAINGFVVRTGPAAFTSRTIEGTVGEVDVVNGNGNAANPVISLPDALDFNGKTIDGGTYTDATLTAPTIGDFTNAQHDHLDADDGGQLTSAAISDFTEAAQDAVAGALVDSATLDFVYDDGLNTITANVLDSPLLQGQDGSFYLARANHTGTQLAATISDFDEAAQDAVGGILADSATLDFTYDDATPAITAAVLDSPLLQGQNGAFYLDRANHTGTQTAATISDFNEAAQDAVGATLTDTATLDLTYDDALNTISGAVLDSPLLGGDTPAFYLDRANHTGTQTAATISDFNEAAQDAVGGILTDSATLDFTYDDGLNTISAAVLDSPLLGGQNSAYHLDRTNHTGTQTAATISDFSEAVDDRVAALLVAGTNVTLTYNDVANTLTIDSTGGGGSYTDEEAQDAVGTILTDTATLNFTYDDATPAITADVLDSPLLQGQNGAYYLARANHTGTQLAATISDFATAVETVGDGLYVELAGDTMTGGLTVPTFTLTGAFLLEDSGAVAFDIRSLANTDIPITLEDADTSWTFGLDNSDSGSFVLSSGGGLGTGNVLRAVPAELSTPVNFVAGANVTLSSGRLFLPNGTESAASLTFANGRGIYATSPEDINFTDGSVIRVQFRLQDNNNTGIEIGRVDGIASLAYYDFHTSATPVDYDARMIVQTGTGVTAQARMDFYCGQFTLTPVGTDAEPTIARTSDLDTGLLWPASNTLAASCGATRVWTATTTDVEFPVGISFGGTVAPGGATDLSRHIELHSSGYGFSITSNTLNHVSSGTTQDFYVSGVNRVRITSAGLNVVSGALQQGGIDVVLDTDIGSTVQAFDADLSALAALATTGLIARTGAGTVAARTITGTANEITVTNGNGVSGNPTLSLPTALTFTGKTVTGGTFTGITDIAVADGGTGASDAATARINLGLQIGTDVQARSAILDAVTALATNGFIARTGVGTIAARTLTAPADGFTITNPAGTAGNPTFVLSDDLAALEGLAGTGIAVRTGVSTWTQRTITAGTGISVTNGNGVSGNPTISLSGGAGPTMKIATSETNSTSTTLATDAAFTTALDASSTYAIELHVVFESASGASDFACTVGFSAAVSTCIGTSYVYCPGIANNSADLVTPDTIELEFTTTSVEIVGVIGSAGRHGTAVINLGVTTTATPVNFVFAWGVNNGGDSINRKIGSYCRVTKAS